MGRFGGRFDERPNAEDTSAEAKRDRVLAHFPPAMVPRAMALITPAQPGRDRCRFSFLADAATGRVALSFAERGAGAAPVDGHALASRRVNDLLPLIVAAANARAPLRANLRAAHVHAPRWAGAEPVVALVYEGPPAGEAAWLVAADARPPRADAWDAAAGEGGAQVHARLLDEEIRDEREGEGAADGEDKVDQVPADRLGLAGDAAEREEVVGERHQRVELRRGREACVVILATE